MDAERLLAHLEAALGPFDEKRSVSETALREREGVAFGIVALGDACLATFGISRHAPIAQELVVDSSDEVFSVTVLIMMGRHVLEQHRALAAGERHRLPGYGDGSLVEGVLAVPDPDVDSLDELGFVRLVPITAAEAAYAGEHGWEALLERLEGRNVADLCRESAV